MAKHKKSFRKKKLLGKKKKNNERHAEELKKRRLKTYTFLCGLVRESLLFLVVTFQEQEKI